MTADEILKEMEDILRGECVCDYITKDKMMDLVEKIDDNTLSSKNVKEMIDDILGSDKSISEIMKEKNITNITDTSILKDIVIKVIEQNPESVQDYQAGKDRALKYLMGQIMKETKGSANPKMVNEILIAELAILNQNIK